MSPELTNTKFVDMVGYVSESIHDLLSGALECLSDSGSSEARNHPSRECLMENPSDEEVGNDNGEATSLASLGNNFGGGTSPQLALWPDQLQVR